EDHGKKKLRADGPQRANILAHERDSFRGPALVDQVDTVESRDHPMEVAKALLDAKRNRLQQGRVWPLSISAIHVHEPNCGQASCEHERVRPLANERESF